MVLSLLHTSLSLVTIQGDVSNRSFVGSADSIPVAGVKRSLEATVDADRLR